MLPVKKNIKIDFKNNIKNENFFSIKKYEIKIEIFAKPNLNPGIAMFIDIILSI